MCHVICAEDYYKCNVQAIIIGRYFNWGVVNLRNINFLVDISHHTGYVAIIDNVDY